MTEERTPTVRAIQMYAVQVKGKQEIEKTLVCHPRKMERITLDSGWVGPGVAGSPNE